MEGFSKEHYCFVSFTFTLGYVDFDFDIDIAAAVDIFRVDSCMAEAADWDFETGFLHIRNAAVTDEVIQWVDHASTIFFGNTNHGKDTFVQVLLDLS